MGYVCTVYYYFLSLHSFFIRMYFIQISRLKCWISVLRINPRLVEKNIILSVENLNYMLGKIHKFHIPSHWTIFKFFFTSIFIHIHDIFIHIENKIFIQHSCYIHSTFCAHPSLHVSDWIPGSCLWTLSSRNSCF